MILILLHELQFLHERFIKATSVHGTCALRKWWDKTRYAKSRKGFLDRVQGLSGKQPRWLTGMNPSKWMLDIYFQSHKMFVVLPVSGCNHGKGLKLDEVSRPPSSTNRIRIGLLFEGTAFQSILEFLMILLLPKNDVLQKGAVQKPERCFCFFSVFSGVWWLSNRDASSAVLNWFMVSSETEFSVLRQRGTLDEASEASWHNPQQYKHFTSPLGTQPHSSLSNFKKMFSPKVSTTNNILTEQKEQKPTNSLRKISSITHQNAAGFFFGLASRSPRALSYIGHGSTSQQTNRWRNAPRKSQNFTGFWVEHHPPYDPRMEDIYPMFSNWKHDWRKSCCTTKFTLREALCGPRNEIWLKMYDWPNNIYQIVHLNDDMQ